MQGAVVHAIMQNFLEGEPVDEKEFIYLGDGSGDFQPPLKSRDGDHVFPKGGWQTKLIYFSNIPHVIYCWLGFL